MDRIRKHYSTPIVHHNDDFVLCQCPAICLFLAKVFGFEPESMMDAARANQIVLTIGDCIVETQYASHPTEMHLSYDDQKEEADRVTGLLCRYDSELSGTDAKQGRLYRLLYPCECELARNNKGKEWFYGSRLSIADVFCACFMRAFEVSRPVEYAEHALPLLKAHRLRFRSRRMVSILPQIWPAFHRRKPTVRSFLPSFLSVLHCSLTLCLSVYSAYVCPYDVCGTNVGSFMA